MHRDAWTRTVIAALFPETGKDLNGHQKESGHLYERLISFLSEKYQEWQYHTNKQPNQKMGGGFPGGAVVENLPANAGDTGSSPGLGRSHMPRSN